ncbi:uncharacterized protein LOC116618007 [Nematostella vectensis]|uniref:uncharacterized protein LOC116618007 n=1 Tax=Nematostella vectensis TaxID=45351 RepID=UPI0020771E9D|nr:uncharacterized protein LOC116618007 [Nematostella vectensis]
MGCALSCSELENITDQKREVEKQLRASQLWADTLEMQIDSKVRELSMRRIDVEMEQDKNRSLAKKISYMERENEMLRKMLKHSEQEGEKFRTELIKTTTELRTLRKELHKATSDIEARITKGISYKSITTGNPNDEATPVEILPQIPDVLVRTTTV